ncbi:MAG: alkaline phosphatase family protein [Clostridia bacterium]|nr:alkaline phosphatase family protein [Clostridia bacterium]
MEKKVILISIDGMRPDGFLQCGNPFIGKMMETSSYTLEGKTVFPSVTLPCHTSLFHSVPPERHCTTTNTYIAPVHPITGLFEQIKHAGGVSAMYYGWEPLRDVSRPGSLVFSEYIHSYSAEATDGILTDRALERIRSDRPDFVFLYMVETDEKGGHDHGWMTAEYLNCVNAAIDNVRRVWEEFGEEYTVVVTADHGGHARSHGTSMKEDMTIPMFYMGKDFPKGRILADTTILDIAPTVAKVMGIAIPHEWEGKAMI